MPKILFETTPSLGIKPYNMIESRSNLEDQLRKLEYVEAIDYGFVRIVLTLKKRQKLSFTTQEFCLQIL